MPSVTQRIAQITQPYGGYLPIKLFSKVVFNDSLTLNESENIHASLVGIAVDYLTRFALGDSVNKAFHISYLGASIINMQSKANDLMKKITGLDDVSIISACKLSGFDVCFRSSRAAYKPIEDINPDSDTIENIRIMVNRSISFWQKYGPIIRSEITFEGGYTDTVSTGDGDFITADTLWDFKVSKSAPTSKHSLQILMYYVMGIHSVHSYFKELSNLGFFNPRLNTAYICPITAIAAETISKIENEVICYGGKSSKETIPRSREIQISKNEYSVADICKMTGCNKSMIYSDIRSGLLRASKKGNKYCIEHSDYLEYIERKKKTQKIQIAIILGIVAALALLMLFIFNRL